MYFNNASDPHIWYTLDVTHTHARTLLTFFSEKRRNIYRNRGNEVCQLSNLAKSTHFGFFAALMWFGLSVVPGVWAWYDPYGTQARCLGFKDLGFTLHASQELSEFGRFGTKK